MLLLIPTAIASALIVAPLTSFDVVTLIFAAAPGGVTEMTMVGLGFGADGAAVASLQFIRVLLAIAIVGLVLSRLGSKENSERSTSDKEDGPDSALAEQSRVTKISRASR